MPGVPDSISQHCELTGTLLLRRDQRRCSVRILRRRLGGGRAFRARRLPFVRRRQLNANRGRDLLRRFQVVLQRGYSLHRPLRYARDAHLVINAM